MNKLEKKEGVYYTQNIENLPIEERVFFREGKGVSATSDNYRVATQLELDTWEVYKEQQDKMLEWEQIYSENVMLNVMKHLNKSVDFANRLIPLVCQTKNLMLTL